MTIINSTRIFNELASNYALYRPSYPKQLFETIANYIKAPSEIADIGAGTGLFTDGLINSGYKVYAVEPNDDMRKEAHKKFKDKQVTILNGSAECTNLSDSSVNLITIAQAFHWLDAKAARKEFIRISKDKCNVAIAWNTRKFDATPFMKELKQLIIENAPDYNTMKNKYWNNLDKDVKQFYNNNCDSFSFQNTQNILCEEFLGYLLSLSYAPQPSSSTYNIFVKSANDLFNKYEHNNRVSICLDTKLYFGVIK